MSPYRVPYIFEVIDGFLTPNKCPFEGDIIKIGVPQAKPYKSVALDEKWQIHLDLQVYDSLSVTFYGTIVVFQIQPVENPLYGRFVEVRREKVENFSPSTPKIHNDHHFGRN